MFAPICHRCPASEPTLRLHKPHPSNVPTPFPFHPLVTPHSSFTLRSTCTPSSSAMNGQLPASWQGRPRDSQPPHREAYNLQSPQQAISNLTPPQTPYYPPIPFGRALISVVASNTQSLSFARRHPAINCKPEFSSHCERTN